jgi:hypothetical protein
MWFFSVFSELGNVGHPNTAFAILRERFYEGLMSILNSVDCIGPIV